MIKMEVVLSSTIWAGVVVLLILRIEKNYRDWVASKTPLAKQQYDEFTARLDDLQNQINAVAMRKEFD